MADMWPLDAARERFTRGKRLTQHFERYGLLC
jgi:hypothetical protein